MIAYGPLIKLAVMRFFLLTLPLIFNLQIVSAQQGDFNFINFSSKDGLSSNSVNAILKDKYGYMWFGTDDGLNRFDGVNFTVYRYSANDSTTIGANTVTALCEDKSGNLWVGTNQTLSFYDRKKDAFINYDFIGNKHVRVLCADYLGNIWAGTYSGLYMFNPRTGLTRNYKSNPAKVGQLMSNTVINVFEDSRRRLWVGTNAGLYLYIKETDNFINYQHSAIDPTSIAGNSVRSIAEDLNGSLWFGTNEGLSKLLPDGKSFKNFKHNKSDINTLSSNRVYVIAPDNIGRLWIGTEEGLNIMDLSSAKTARIISDSRNKYSFLGRFVRTIYIDKNGIFWFGTQQGGVNKYDQNLAFFNLRQSNSLDPYGLSSPVVTSFVENPAGDIYVGTDGGGLNLYHRKTGLFSHPRLGNNDKSKALSVMAMERVANELWIGTYQKGLYVLNMVSGVVKHYGQGNGPKDLSGNDIFCIKRDSRGHVWVGTNGNGVNMYDPKSGVFYRFPETGTVDSAKTHLNGYIRTIEEDKSGNIWIGFHGSGIAVYDPSSKRFKILNRENSDLPSNNVLSIHEDRNGAIWVGTFGNGLSMYDKNDNKFISYSESEGLCNGIIYKILEDESGKLWLSTNKGISCFDQSSRKFKNYSYQNGLQQSTFCLGSGLRTLNGELFFGGLDGFNYFHPLALPSNKYVPSLLFTDLKISNRSVIPGQEAAIKEDISIAKEIRLEYKQNFSLDFAALNYTSPQDNRYSYKLEGFDKDWNHIGTSHTAVYTNLDPGEYMFRVKAKSDDGLWSTPETVIKIHVKSPFWLTIYAYIFYVVAAGLLIGLLRHHSIRKLKNKYALEQERLQVRQMIEQERKDAERQHEFDLLKIKFLTNLSHEFRTPISLILGPLERMLERETNDEKLEQLSLIGRNARRLLNLVNQLLDFRKLEENELKLNLTEGDIVSFIKEVADSFKDISEYKHINFTFSSSLNHLHTSFDKDKIERILLNLLSNAFKFTGKDGEIWLKVEEVHNSNLKIIISDTGIGMVPDVQEKIFDRFFQGNVQTTVVNQGNGIGLSITREFVKLHGGSISVESKPGKGSVFTVLLPCEPISRFFEESKLISGEGIHKVPAGQPQHDKEVPGPEKLTVLLIEDNDDFRNYLKDNLKSHYKIVEASNGKEGWQKVLSSHPKVIVSDINMPCMDGVTLSRKIKSDKRTNHIPIILLTALTGDADQLRGLQTGASDYLTKPFNFEILNIKIRNLLSLNQTLQNTYTRQLKVVPEIDVQSEDEKLLVNIIQYIESNIDSPDLSVEELSKHVFMSRGSLYNKIVNLTGETPVEFIRSIKLKKAAALLENSDMKIAQIGYAVGFSTPNYFARAFKAKFNVSPSEYVTLKKNHVDSGRQPQPVQC